MFLDPGAFSYNTYYLHKLQHCVITQILAASRDNGGIYLCIDNAKLAAEDFKTKYVSE